MTWQAQRFILSTSVAVFNDNGNGQERSTINPTGDDPGVPGTAEMVERDGGKAEAIGSENAAADIAAATGTATETAQERLGKLATAVVKELRRGIDVGSIAAARAQAIRR